MRIDGCERAKNYHYMQVRSGFPRQQNMYFPRSSSCFAFCWQHEQAKSIRIETSSINEELQVNVRHLSICPPRGGGDRIQAPLTSQY